MSAINDMISSVIIAIEHFDIQENIKHAVVVLVVMKILQLHGIRIPACVFNIGIRSIDHPAGTPAATFTLESFDMLEFATTEALLQVGGQPYRGKRVVQHLETLFTM